MQQNDFRPAYFRASADFLSKAANVQIGEDAEPHQIDLHFALLTWAQVYATLATVPDSVIAHVRVEELEQSIQNRMMRDKLREVAAREGLQDAAHEAVTSELHAEDEPAEVAVGAPHLAVVK